MLDHEDKKFYAELAAELMETLDGIDIDTTSSKLFFRNLLINALIEAHYRGGQSASAYHGP